MMDEMDDEPRVYTVLEAARLLLLTEQTVYQMVRDGEIGSLRVRGDIRITSRHLERWSSHDDSGKEG